jgi:hypothetical protein
MKAMQSSPCQIPEGKRQTKKSSETCQSPDTAMTRLAINLGSGKSIFPIILCYLDCHPKFPTSSSIAISFAPQTLPKLWNWEKWLLNNPSDQFHFSLFV